MTEESMNISLLTEEVCIEINGEPLNNKKTMNLS